MSRMNQNSNSILNMTEEFSANRFDLPKVSIVVPMYNVAPYARNCLTSLVEQTYGAVEIVVIDDGSNDKTYDICLSFAEKDNRVKFFSKENGGLSSARNFGLSKATGDYLTFVDGDDILDKRAIEHLVNLAQRYEVPLVTCQYKKISNLVDFGKEPFGSTMSISGDQLLKKMLLLDGESGSACAKLFSRNLLSLLVFPEGQLFEDFGVIANVFSKIDRACVSDARLYGYLTRNGSITTSKAYGDKHLDGMESSLAVVRTIVQDKPELKDSFDCFEAFCSLRVASRLDFDMLKDVERGKRYVDEARNHCRDISGSSQVSNIWRFRCTLFSISPVLHNVIYHLYGILTGKVAG